MKKNVSDTSRRGSTGFTLIEVMVAVGILAISLVAIAGVNAGSIRATTDIKFYVIATQLARLQMLEFEHEMAEKGFSEFEETEIEGDFDDWEFPGWKWKIKVTKVELELPTSVPGQEENAMAGMVGYASIIGDIIKNTMREIQLTIWLDDDAGYTNEITVATHVIDTSKNGLFKPGANVSDLTKSTNTNTNTNTTKNTTQTSPFTSTSKSPFSSPGVNYK